MEKDLGRVHNGYPFPPLANLTLGSFLYPQSENLEEFLKEISVNVWRPLRTQAPGAPNSHASP